MMTAMDSPPSSLVAVGLDFPVAVLSTVSDAVVLAIFRTCLRTVCQSLERGPNRLWFPQWFSSLEFDRDRSMYLGFDTTLFPFLWFLVAISYYSPSYLFFVRPLLLPLYSPKFEARGWCSGLASVSLMESTQRNGLLSSGFEEEGWFRIRTAKELLRDGFPIECSADDLR